MSRHIVIPDCQVKPGNNLAFLERIGKYIVDRKPDVIINIGDFADMPSLSSYDVGKKAFEGRRYKNDIEVTHKAMETLLGPINEYNNRAKKNKEKQYKPKMILTYGNHENRINRVIDSDPKLDGTIDLSDLKYESYGWSTVPFLEPIVVDGIAYCHYFTSGALGRPCVSAQQQLAKKHMSVVAGHQQGFQIHTGHRGDGARLTSIIAGSCYEHDEDYMGPQGNKHWRGILEFNEVNNGEFDTIPVSLNYLERKYA